MPAEDIQRSVQWIMELQATRVVNKLRDLNHNVGGVWLGLQEKLEAVERAESEGGIHPGGLGSESPEVQALAQALKGEERAADEWLAKWIDLKTSMWTSLTPRQASKLNKAWTDFSQLRDNVLSQVPDPYRAEASRYGHALGQETGIVWNTLPDHQPNPAGGATSDPSQEATPHTSATTQGRKL
jgi:hypothetical protein